MDMYNSDLGTYIGAGIQIAIGLLFIFGSMSRGK